MITLSHFTIDQRTMLIFDAITIILQDVVSSPPSCFVSGHIIDITDTHWIIERTRKGDNDTPTGYYLMQQESNCQEMLAL